MVFSTDREIGLQILPLDGNPYTNLGLTGHPHQVFYSLYIYFFSFC